MKTMDISIIILTKNGGANFPRLLERILEQRFGGSYEVIVIDSGSTDSTLEAARSQPVILKQIPPQEFHHGRTRNLGVEMARGDYIVFITQDALPLDEKWLQHLIDGFDDASVAMVVGRQIPWEHTRPPEKFFCYYNFPAFKIVVQSGADYYHDNVFISNVNSAFRREILLEHKFDENIVMAEDKEIAARLLKNGMTVNYEPSAPVYHAHDYSLKSLFERSLDYGLALRQGADALPASNMPRLRRLIQLIGCESQYLRASGGWLWVPYMLVYEASKYGGLLLGKAGLLRGPEARRMRCRHA